MTPMIVDMSTPPAIAAFYPEDVASPQYLPAEQSSSLLNRIGRVSQAGSYFLAPADAASRGWSGISSVLINTAHLLGQLLRLPPNWDTYGARQVSVAAVNSALAWLGQIDRPALPQPSVVPTSEGGVQLEWHSTRCDLEVMFSAKGIGSYSFESRAPSQMEEGLIGFENEYGNRLIELMVGNS